MSREATAGTFGDFKRAVSGQIEAGLSFGQVEDFIDACPIDDEHKAALWLWAWLKQPPEVLRTLADSHLLDLAQAARR